jgi:hypothetical protein
MAANLKNDPLGSWEPNGEGGLEARTIDFNVPPSTPAVAHPDYTVKFAQDGRQMVLVEISLSVCFCRVKDFADFKPPGSRP